MDSSTIKPTAVSAPGKVLLAGGYLVLDPAYTGLVFALSARIHCVSAANPDAPPNTITVRSPQFTKEQEWVYRISGTENNAGTAVEQLGGSRNPFIEKAILYVYSYLSVTTVPAIKITIFADNDYYSQPPIDLLKEQHPRFNKLPTTIKDANKTGLGSSAALTTSFTGCLYRTLLSTTSTTTTVDTEVIHNLAQAAHCAAQGKIGSGFDVAAAVWGSCIYRRFPASTLEVVGDAGTPDFSTRLREVVDSKWQYEATKTIVPPGFRVVMGDVRGGSETPGMVKTVLKWRQDNPEAAKTRWDTIHSLNTELISWFAQTRDVISEIGEKEYAAAAKKYVIAQSPPSDAKIFACFEGVRKVLNQIREQMRIMGKEAGVEIEPPAQTELIDRHKEAIFSVLGGVVPGAGGHDAVALVVLDLDDGATVDVAIPKVMPAYNCTPLRAREEMEGIKEEDPNSYAAYL